MSEVLKFFASLFGAIAAHLLLLIVTFLLMLSERSAGLAAGRTPEPTRKGPKEVTVMLTDLLDQVELEATPEPEVPEPEPEPDFKPFQSTDLNTPEAEAPEDYQFESDRNTTAATELMPDSSIKEANSPTLDGDKPFPVLDLQNRDFVDGEFDQPPAMEAATMAAARPAGGRPAYSSAPINPDIEVDAPPSTEAREASEEETVEGVSTDPREKVGERFARPEVEIGSEMKEASVTESFVDPNAEGATLPPGPMKNATDETATVTEAGDVIGDAEDLPRESMEAAAPGDSVDKLAGDQPGEMETLREAADDSLFASGFSPEERQNVVNGSLMNEGQNAVNAKDTPMGRYQAEIRKLISRTWHRHAQENGISLAQGYLRYSFRIESSGQVRDIRLITDESTTLVAEFTLKAIKSVKLPPIPPEVAETLGPSGFEMDWSLYIY